MPEHPPVTDWVNDFDHTDPTWTENPFPIWEKLRAASPVVHTERFLGCYLPTTYQAVKEISYDTDHFSSRRVIVRDSRPEITARAPPITSDPPDIRTRSSRARSASTRWSSCSRPTCCYTGSTRGSSGPASRRSRSIRRWSGNIAAKWCRPTAR
jgi:hypothetical protein